MRSHSLFVARIKASIPMERVLTYAKNGHIPQIGEVGEFDQAFTVSGVAYQSVYRLDESGKELWSADLLASEYEVLPRAAASSPNTSLERSRDP
jgi:hypothetical protein